MIMRKSAGKAWKPGVWFFALLFLWPAAAAAEFVDYLSKFYPHLTVQEQYSDNLFLSSTNRVSDYLTVISPGIRFSTVTSAQPEAAVDLNYTLGLNFYAKNSDLNYVSHTADLNAWYTYNRRLSLRLREYFIRSENPLERAYYQGALPNEYLPESQGGRFIYTRNVVEPSIGYQLGREDRFDLFYRNMFYNNENPQIQDSQENHIRPRLIYWFNMRNGMELETAVTRGEFSKIQVVGQAQDFWSYRPRARYIYRFSPRTSVFGELLYEHFNVASPDIDYDIYNPTIGFSHSFTPTLTVYGQFGYFWQKPQFGEEQTGPSYDAGITQVTPRTTYVLSFRGGYANSFFNSQNSGFVTFNEVLGNITHLLERRLSVGLNGSLNRVEYVDARPSHTDWIWRIGGRITYLPLRWLSISLDAYHAQNDSDLSTAFGYKENRVFLSLTAFYGAPGQGIPNYFPVSTSGPQLTPPGQPGYGMPQYGTQQYQHKEPAPAPAAPAAPETK